MQTNKKFHKSCCTVESGFLFDRHKLHPAVDAG